MGIIETEGIVTKELKYGDSSKILTVITKDLGKISVIASNVRGNKMRAFAGLQAFTYGEFVLFRGKGKLYKLNEFNSLNSFGDIHESLEALALASYFADVANYICDENMVDAGFLSLLLNSLFLLSKGYNDYIKLKTVFEFKTMTISGYAPNFEDCAACKRKVRVKYLKVDDGTSICEKCSEFFIHKIEINSTVINAIEYMCWSEMKKMISFEISKELLSYISVISELYLGRCFEHRFNTLDYFKEVMLLGENYAKQN